ncbi:hypothetical protein C8J56DRAFT_892958 [Mycena floridula]|nr:hypothetical protein C8J56DRAFT_892958 [Mycena floridula]
MTLLDYGSSAVWPVSLRYLMSHGSALRSSVAGPAARRPYSLFLAISGITVAVLATSGQAALEYGFTLLLFAGKAQPRLIPANLILLGIWQIPSKYQNTAGIQSFQAGIEISQPENHHWWPKDLLLLLLPSVNGRRPRRQDNSDALDATAVDGTFLTNDLGVSMDVDDLDPSSRFPRPNPLLRQNFNFLVKVVLEDARA